MVKNSIGVMQGRLLPKYDGRYQAHPVGYWQDEFSIASTLNLFCIEFIFDYNDYQANPLIADEGVNKISEVIQNSGVKVVSICADYFMEAPLHHPDIRIFNQGRDVLIKLIKNSRTLGIRDIVIPCVDQSSLKSEDDKNRFVDRILEIAEFAEDSNVNLSLETDLDPRSFADLLFKLPSTAITVNYDTGNSAALGYQVTEEFEAYGARISDIHIKDRLLCGGSVELGSGNVNFDLFFDTLKSIDFNGPLIMQAYRDDEGLGIFKRQLLWLKENYLTNT
ncbi:MAG TPA: sugar phosphate isomerase/epimerase family protein [Sphingobacteriaceae bacterium]